MVHTNAVEFTVDSPLQQWLRRGANPGGVHASVLKLTADVMA